MDSGGRGSASEVDDRPRLVLAAGPRATEAALIARVRRDREAVLASPERLAHPLRIIVPSRSAREHVRATVVRAMGAPVAGLQVQTLHGIARELLDRSGGRPRDGEGLVAEVVRDCARAEPRLARALDDLEDAYGVVEATVRDLLDAGFGAPLEEAALERIDAEELGGEGAALGQAVIRVAARVSERLDAFELGTSTHALAAAREALESSATMLDSRGVVIHGFAEATGVGSDFIEALVRYCEAGVLLDLPELHARGKVEERATPGSVSPGPFAQRLFDRLAGVLPVEIWDESPELEARIDPLEVLVAPGDEAEVRAVAERIRQLLDSNVSAESIGVVAREPSAYRVALRTHLGRLAIPYSALSLECVGGAAARRVSSLERLLAQRGNCTVECWLELASWGLEHADAREPDSSARAPAARAEWADLRIAAHALGAGRLRDLALLEAPHHDVPLPVRHGVRSVDAEADEGEADDEREWRVARRRLDRGVFAWAIDSAKRVTRELERWPDSATFAVHLTQLRKAVVDGLGLVSVPSIERLFEALDLLADRVPEAFPFSRAGFSRLCGRELNALSHAPLGGLGGGVQVLSVMEARARTFAHLFVLGLNRDVFPRVAREDPLLPDDARRSLRDLLPDLPIKTGAVEEERYLFGQLLRASAHLTLSRLSAADDGSPKAPSSLLESLRQRIARSGGQLEEKAVSGVYEPPAADEEPRIRPAHESLLLIGLTSRARPERLWRAALEDAPVHEMARDVAALAAARIAVLAEFDPSYERAQSLGPYFGFAGEVRDEGDPRSAPFYVTALEQLARCPWQYFVERLLRIEPIPDPLECLPELDSLAIGSAAHEVLEQIGTEVVGVGARSGLEAAVEGEGFAFAWPDAEELAEITRRVARKQIAQGGRGWPGFEAMLRERIEPVIARARELDEALFGDPTARMLGVELEGRVQSVDLAGKTRAIAFRVDRVDRVGESVLLTDYKTGKPFADGKQLATRRLHLLKHLRSGTSIQAAAYALALDEGERFGRYLYLKDDAEPATADLRASATDAELREAFRASVAELLEGRDRGAFVPRVIDSDTNKEPKACDWCAVSEACLRGDTGARRRLEHRSALEVTLSDCTPAEVALAALWRLPKAGAAAKASGEAKAKAEAKAKKEAEAEAKKQAKVEASSSPSAKSDAKSGAKPRAKSRSKSTAKGKDA